MRIQDPPVVVMSEAAIRAVHFLAGSRKGFGLLRVERRTSRHNRQVEEHSDRRLPVPLHISTITLTNTNPPRVSHVEQLREPVHVERGREGTFHSPPRRDRIHPPAGEEAPVLSQSAARKPPPLR